MEWALFPAIWKLIRKAAALSLVVPCVLGTGTLARAGDLGVAIASQKPNSSSVSVIQANLVSSNSAASNQPEDDLAVLDSFDSLPSLSSKTKNAGTEATTLMEKNNDEIFQPLRSELVMKTYELGRKVSSDTNWICASYCGGFDDHGKLRARAVVDYGDDAPSTYAKLTRQCTDGTLFGSLLRTASRKRVLYQYLVPSSIVDACIAPENPAPSRSTDTSEPITSQSVKEVAVPTATAPAPGPSSARQVP